MDGTTVTIGGYGKRFQWGNYKDGNNEIIKGSFESPTKYSSCMTTEEGPVDTRFQYCDAKWVEIIVVTNLNIINLSTPPKYNIMHHLNISRSITPSYSFSSSCYPGKMAKHKDVKGSILLPNFLTLV